MRRGDRELTEASEIYAVMKKCAVCSLALHGGDYPYVVPVNFGAEEKDGAFTLYFHGAGEGTKMRLLKKNNCVSFCMTGEETFEMKDTACSATMRYVSVCGHGKAEIVDDEEEKIKGLTCIMGQYTKEHSEFVFDEHVLKKTTVFRITAEQITGKVNRKPY